MALTKNDLKEIRQRKYLGRDFDSLRSILVDYARLYHADKISDFSEAGIGGLFLDFAATVGDNLSFYLDHLYGELDVETAVETKSIERELRNAGITISGAAPSNVNVELYIKVPSALEAVDRVPSSEALPVIKTGSVFYGSGIRFELLEDIDFGERDTSNLLIANYKSADIDKDGKPKNFVVAKSGLCISGKTTTETFQLDSEFVPFKQITLSNPDVSEILSVTDDLGNIYYEVQSHTSDVVYVNASNTNIDSSVVKDTIKVIPAPYRFVRKTDLSTRTTVLVLGGGNADSLEDDVIPDPSELAIPFVYRKTFSRVALNPEQLLQTKTLGVYAINTTLSVTYRYGGGLNHNVPANTIRDIAQLVISFPQNPSLQTQVSVRNSVECSNPKKAEGGEDALTVDDMKQLIPSMKNMQERIVSKQDLLARVYTMPSNFGRVFRAAVHSSPNNPLASQLFIISRDADSKLSISPDTLKKNLISYLNPYRLVSDAIELVDARIINLQVKFEVLTDITVNKNIVLQTLLRKLVQLFDIKNFNIDQPVVLSDIHNTIFATEGVISLNELKITNLYGNVVNRQYSDNSFDVSASTVKNVIVPPIGAIFEVRYPEVDIIGRVV